MLWKLSFKHFSPTKPRALFLYARTRRQWVFHIKENPDDTLNKYNARLLAKGSHQVQGFYFNQIIYPIIKPFTINFILTLDIINRCDVQQIDINNVFLNGVLHDDVFMVQPPEFESIDREHVCKLDKSLYGLN